MSTEDKSSGVESTPTPTLTITYISERPKSVLPPVPGETVLMYRLSLDSKVTKVVRSSNDETVKSSVLIDNQHHFVNNETFQNDPVKITNYLRRHGKIPEFLYVTESTGKGLGLFSSEEIKEDTILGFFQGLNQPIECIDVTNRYSFGSLDFQGKPSLQINMENILFSNCFRFLNDSAEPNINTIAYGHQVLVVANRDISANEELTTSYPDTYWEVFGGRI